jgi:hypothetical protein
MDKKIWYRLAESDTLKDTVDYVLLNQIVENEMAIPSKLLENVTPSHFNYYSK